VCRNHEKDGEVTYTDKTEKIKWKEDKEGQTNEYIQELNYTYKYEGWNFNSGNYLFTTDTK